VRLLFIAAALVAPSSCFNAPTLGRRSVVLGGAAALASAPTGAFALSKSKAAEKALQKETAKEAREAMKEYKFAPRPVLEGNAASGYSYKEGTVGAGSQGELASYFKDKGAKIQAEYKAENARATGATAAEAKKMAQTLEEKALAERKAAYLAKRNKKSIDEIEIEKFCLTPAGKTAVDNVGRKMCPGA